MMQRKPSLTYFPRGMYSSNTLVHVCSPFELVFQTTEAEETEYMWKSINRMGG